MEVLGAWSPRGGPHGGTTSVERRTLRPVGSEELSTDDLWLCGPGGGATHVGFRTDDGDGHFVRVTRSRDGLHLERSLSGGERMYVRHHEGRVFFSSSVRPLLALGNGVERSVLPEVLLSGLVMFGDRTLHAGIREVLAGHTATLTPDGLDQRWVAPDTLQSWEGSLKDNARRCHDTLTEAVVRAAGPHRPVCVALSGGIDSSAIAAAAVEAFGADQVRAITYEFGDPTHSTEVDWATRVAQHLGITDHVVFSLDESAYLDAVPEAMFLNESLVHWPKAFMLLVARKVASLGHDRYLTGFGIGSHTGWLQEAGSWIERLGSRVTRHWREARFGHTGWPFQLQRLHPALEPPHPRIYLMVLRLLHARGIVGPPRDFFPPRMAPLLEPLETPPVDADPTLPLGRQLQLQALSHLVSCIDVTRSERASRKLGVHRIAPAHFRTALGGTYFPARPTPRLYSGDRALRPGKLLVREAFRDHLPDDVLYRTKSWGDAVASDRWLSLARTRMLTTLPRFPADTRMWDERYPDVLRWWEAHSILASSLGTRLWHRIFVERPHDAPSPTWSNLCSS